MTSRRDRLTGNTSPTTATTAKRPKRKPSSNPKPKKSPSSGGTSSTQQPTNTSVGYYNDAAVGTSPGLYDPNATYGRTPTGANVGTFNEWLSNNGYANKKHLSPNKRQNLQQQYTQAQGPQGPFVTTDAGEALSTKDPGGYYDSLMAEAGSLANPNFASTTAFGQYLMGARKQQRLEAYNAANIKSGGNLSMRDYMTSAGYAPGQQQGTLLGAAPHDTGNPFTSTSLPQPGTQVNQSYNNVRDYAQAQGVNHFGQLGQHGRHNLQNAYQASQNAYTASMTNPTLPSPAAPALPTIPAVDGLAEDRTAFNSMTPQQRGINGSTANRPGRWAVYG